MENVIRTPIKELIARHPEVGSILDEYGIGCVPCGVGTCLLSDIVEIHDLPPEEEESMMRRIASVVSPGVSPALQARKRPSTSRKKEIAYSPPMKRLVDEHVLIKRFIALVPRIVADLDLSSEFEKRRILDGVDFIRCYADRFHHAKEEDILFACFDPGLDILKAMHEDHRKGRACVREAIDAVERGDSKAVAVSLRNYSEILTGHIKKEDEILYPWMDRCLSTRQVGELFSSFREVDERFEEDRRKYETFVFDLEKTLIAQIAEVLG
jgi:hemerythrin-like domain-containing protein